MDEPIDHLREFQKLARTSTTTNYRTINGLDTARTHQAHDRAKLAKNLVVKKHGKTVLTPELRAAVLIEEGTMAEVAQRLGISTTLVFRIRREADR